MKTSRQRLLEYLQEKKVATAPELSRVFKVSAANTRHHLSILIAEGAVEVIGIRSSNKRGRPTQIYSVTQHVTQHNLDRLASALLNEILADYPLDSRNSRLRQIASRLVGDRSTFQGNLTQRLYKAVTRLNQMAYHARWEARSDAPHIMFTHCPYTSILPEHPELCLLDSFLLEEMLGGSVIQTVKLERTPQGTPQCVFKIKKQVSQRKILS